MALSRIWVYAEARDGEVLPITLEILSKAKELADTVECVYGGDGSAVAHREIEGGTEVVETSLPAVVTTQKGLNEPRYASLKGIMAAKKKPMQSWGPADLGLDVQSAGKPKACTLAQPPRPSAASALSTVTATRISGASAERSST